MNIKYVELPFGRGRVEGVKATVGMQKKKNSRQVHKLIFHRHSNKIKPEKHESFSDKSGEKHCTLNSKINLMNYCVFIPHRSTIIFCN